MKIVYTESGKAALEAFKSEKAKELENAILSKKYVFGDEEVEITAADVKTASQSSRVSYNRKLRSIELSAHLYFVIGILTALVGLFFDRLQALFKDKPFAAMLVLAGGMMTGLSLLIKFWLKVRYKPEMLMSENFLKKIDADVIMDARERDKAKSEK